MAKVIYSAVECVRITIRGVGRVEKDFGRCSTISYLKDGGLVQRFDKYLKSEQIKPVSAEWPASAGLYIGSFTPVDAVKVEKWLLKEGAKKKK